jgi:glycosyltransferase involved in cell wall biosynthesis
MLGPMSSPSIAGAAAGLAPKVSVVVPAFNEEKLLARSLAAIQCACGAFDEIGWAWEIVVCDNNSSDRTPQIAQAAGAVVVFEPVNQISRARNRGASVARGEWLVFVDADSYPSRALFAAAAVNMRRPDCLGGGCLVKLDERSPSSDLLLLGWNTISRTMRWAAGSFIYCERSVFVALGGFSDQLFASEELDFSRRLKRWGRERRKRMIIITRERLVTSARKMTLYSKSEHFRFFFRTLWNPRKMLGNRESCHVWYDGRR